MAFVFRTLVAIGIGALIGIEREQSASGGHFAGARTLLLVALLGALVQAFFPGLLPVALGFLALTITVGYAGKVFVEGDLGMTTAIATALTFFYGALTMYSERGILLAIVLGVLTTAVLAVKENVQQLVGRISREERLASVKFLVVAFVVLPLLPSREMDALYGLNPQFVWLMVVFVSGLSFLGYLLAKVIGTERGIGLSGLLGGFVSSTATAVTMANRADENPDLSDICGAATVVATIAMLPRAIVEVAVIYPELVSVVVVPILTMAGVGTLLSVWLLWRVHTTEPVETELTNPFRLRPALSFGVVFAAILLISERASAVFGATGIYATAFVTGLADVDSVTISLAKLAREGSISPTVATTGIVVAAIANTVVKVGIAWALGTRRLGKLVMVILGVTGITGLVALLLV